MTKVVRLELSFDNEEWEEFMEHEEVQDMPYDFFFALLCQEYPCGFLSGYSVENVCDD